VRVSKHGLSARFPDRPSGPAAIKPWFSATKQQGIRLDEDINPINPGRIESLAQKTNVTGILKSVISHGLREVQNAYALRLVCFQTVVRNRSSRRCGRRDYATMAPAYSLAVRSISARAALYARPRSKMAREVRTGRKPMKVRAGKGHRSSDASKSVIFAQSTNLARALMAAEIFMAAANCGGSIPYRARAEKLLDNYFALVEQAVPWTEHNLLDRRC